MEAVHRACKLPAFDDLIGVPFEDGGRDEKTALDCWGVALAVQRRLGVQVPDFKVSAFNTPGISGAASAAMASGCWVRVEKPEPGDMALMAINADMPDMINHFGVCIGNNRLIHSLLKTGCLIWRLDHPFLKHKLKGFMRWNPGM